MEPTSVTADTILTDRHVDPISLARHMLDLTGRALMSAKAEMFCPLFLLPQEMETNMGQRTIETQDQLRGFFDSVSHHFRTTGVTRLDRSVSEAERVTPDVIVSSHISRVYKGEVAAQKPFTCFTVFRWTDQGWQIARTAYAISDNLRHNAALMGVRVAQ